VPVHGGIVVAQYRPGNVRRKKSKEDAKLKFGTDATLALTNGRN